MKQERGINLQLGNGENLKRVTKSSIRRYFSKDPKDAIHIAIRSKNFPDSSYMPVQSMYITFEKQSIPWCMGPRRKVGLGDD